MAGGTERNLLREELLREHSKAQTMRIVGLIGNDQSLFDELVGIFLHAGQPLAQRAAWVLRYCAEAHPEWAERHLEALLKNLHNPVHDAVKRNTVRLLEFLPMPERLAGEAIDLLFRWLADPRESVAVRCFSMTSLYNICQHEPDLLEELRLTIEDALPNGSAGIRSRGAKLLRAIGKPTAPS